MLSTGIWPGASSAAVVERLRYAICGPEVRWEAETECKSNSVLTLACCIASLKFSDSPSVWLRTQRGLVAEYRERQSFPRLYSSWCLPLLSRSSGQSRQGNIAHPQATSVEIPPGL